MHRSLLFIATVSGALAACDVEPADADDVEVADVSLLERKGGENVKLLDECDPATFDAAVGPGTCVGDGDTSFDEFIDELIDTQVAEDWEFSKDEIEVKPGAVITVTNKGGEVHSFTPVAEFGGGVVPVLNELSGNPVPAPECLSAAAGATFVPSGGTLEAAAPESGTVKYQCCIHPWMRLEATVKKD